MKLRPVLIAAALLGLTMPATAVKAQCLLCGKAATSTATTTPAAAEEPLRIEISAQLDFSRVATGNGGGSVTVDPQTGARRLTGNVVDLGGMALTGEAEVRGTAGRSVRVVVPTEIMLDGDHGASARVVDLVTDLGPAARLDASGRLRFRFGGRLKVTSDDDGSYRGRIPISVEYE